MSFKCFAKLTKTSKLSEKKDNIEWQSTIDAEKIEATWSQMIHQSGSKSRAGANMFPNCYRLSARIAGSADFYGLSQRQINDITWPFYIAFILR